MSEWWMLAAAALALACLVAVTALLRAHHRTQAELVAARAEQRELRARLEEVSSSVAPSPGTDVALAPATQEFLITEVGAAVPSPDEAAVPARIEGRLFADIVLRESLVKAASWAYGARRALSAEQRNRIRFEVRRETRRTAKQRRADTKEALRQYYARERGDVA